MNQPIWQPAIYEHKAALIKRTPAEVSRSCDRMVAATQAEIETYQPDSVTVGLDIYCLEAEALGATSICPDAKSCPELKDHLFDLDKLPEEWTLPDFDQVGRFQMMLDAGCRLKEWAGEQTKIRIAATGPVTLAAKLVGIEPLIMSLCLKDGQAESLLDFTTRLTTGWCACIRGAGLDGVVFDSMAAPPIFSPALYRLHVLPLHQQIFTGLEKSGQTERELVIGGNTTMIAPMLKECGANILLCDFAAEASAFRSAFGEDTGFSIRRNINPSRLLDPDKHQILDTFIHDLNHFTHPIAGTGIVPYDFPSKKLQQFRADLTSTLADLK